MNSLGGFAAEVVFAYDSFDANHFHTQLLLFLAIERAIWCAFHVSRKVGRKTSTLSVQPSVAKKKKPSERYLSRRLLKLSPPSTLAS